MYPFWFWRNTKKEQLFQGLQLVRICIWKVCNKILFFSFPHTLLQTFSNTLNLLHYSKREYLKPFADESLFNTISANQRSNYVINRRKRMSCLNRTGNTFNGSRNFLWNGLQWIIETSARWFCLYLHFNNDKNAEKVIIWLILIHLIFFYTNMIKKTCFSF